MKNLKALIAMVLACTTLLSCMVFTASAASINDFKDLDKTADYYEAVEWAVEQGYMSGMSSTRFSPHTTLTRAQFTMLMAQFDGADLAAYKGKQVFDDVKTNAWYAPTVAWAAENKIVNGTGNGKFSPNNVITREQIAMLVQNYINYKGIYLEKVTPETRMLDRGSNRASSWAKESVVYAYKTGYMQLNDKNCFKPKATVTRANAAIILRDLNTAIERLYVERDPRLITYLDCSAAYDPEEFAKVDILNLIPAKASGTSQTINESFVKRITQIRPIALQQNPDMKFILTITVDSGADIEKWMQPYSNCEDFANNVVELVKKYDFDGIDFDYEFPTGALPQKNLEYFLKVLREKFDALKVEMNKPQDYDYIISMAIPGGLYSFSLYQDLSELQHYVDFFNFMDYDLMIGDARTTAFTHSAVYSAGYGHGTFDDIIRSIQMGVQRDKIVIGSGTYIQAWSGVEPQYNKELDIYTGMYGQGKWVRSDSTALAAVYGLINYKDNSPIGGYYTYFDEGTHSVSLYNPETKYFMSCDEDWSLEEKCRLIKEYNIGGLMIFTYNTCTGIGLLDRIDNWLH